MVDLAMEYRLNGKEATVFWNWKCPDCEHLIEQYGYDEMSDHGYFSSRTRYKCEHCGEIYEEYYSNEPGVDRYYVERCCDDEQIWND